MARDLTPYICTTCGVQYAAAEAPPERCRICATSASSSAGRWGAVRRSKEHYLRAVVGE